MTNTTKVYHNGPDAIAVVAGGTISFADDTTLINPHVVRNLRTRVATADVNTGVTLLPAIAGYKYRMVGCEAIAIGGAAGAVTTVDVKGTQSSGVVLVSFAQASLTRSAVLKAGGTGAAVLADGASFVANDVNTAITLIKAGSNMTTATAVDINLSYTIEAA